MLMARSGVGNTSTNGSSDTGGFVAGAGQFRAIKGFLYGALFSIPVWALLAWLFLP